MPNADTPRTALPAHTRPVIGLNMAMMEEDQPLRAKAVCHAHYIDAVADAGGLPLLIPPYRDLALLREAVARVDALVLIGGHDYDPAAYGGRPQPAEQLVGERRQRADLRLAAHVLERTALPVLGVCGGHQLLAIARGGALVQDIGSEWSPPPGAAARAALPHDSDGRAGTAQAGNAYRHAVRIAAGSRLATIVGATRVEANSWHHQAVDPARIGRGLVATAWADDGVIEALELPGERFALGVQWHPERLGDEPAHRALFTALIRAAGQARARSTGSAG